MCKKDKHTTYGDFFDPMKMYRSKDCVKKFVEHIEVAVKRLYATFPQQTMTELTDVLKRGHKAAENCDVYFKEFNNSENRKVRYYCHCTCL